MNRLEQLELLRRQREHLLLRLPQTPQDIELRLEIVELAQRISDLEEDLTFIEKMILAFDRLRFRGST